MKLMRMAEETQRNSSSSSKTFEIRKMGCSFLRQCRRRTQSEPPRKLNRDKLKAKNKTSRHSTRSADEVDISRRKDDDFTEENTQDKHKGECNIENEHMQDTSELQTCSRCDHEQNRIQNDDEGGGGGNLRMEEPSCLSKFICCRRNRKNSLSYKNNNVYPYTLEQYLKVADSEVSSTVDSRSTCFSSLNTEQSSQCPTITSSSEQSRVFGSENSSANLSHDSGFDEPQCFINMIYENHRCKGYYSCHKKDKASLNIHLKNLMNCMPKSFGEKEDETDQPMRTFKGASLRKRRNAICETSNEARKKFYDALCAFMTLQAMAKYDFL
uniref:Uncharacterized protein n=1 Tax=Clytia hemisphaerica TaxID=252671 RepID=A0A7M5X3X7_9CNID